MYAEVVTVELELSDRLKKSTIDLAYTDTSTQGFELVIVLEKKYSE